MSNYKWVKMSDDYVELRKEDFSVIPRFLVNDIDPILMKKLESNGINYELEGDRLFEECRYVLSNIDNKFVSITAPLYEFSLDLGQYILLSETYTEDVIVPNEYELIKETYLRCVEEVYKEQSNIFDKLFMERSIDGITSVVIISSDPDLEPNYFYEQYIPEGYIKICQSVHPFTHTKHDVVFIKDMDAQGHSVTMKINGFYKGLVIGKGGKNIKRIAKMINAKKINVI